MSSRDSESAARRGSAVKKTKLIKVNTTFLDPEGNMACAYPLIRSSFKADFRG
jgi:hypothetical protein